MLNRSQLNALNNADITSNGAGQITGSILNTVLGNVINSVGILSDANEWSGQNTFDANPAFSSIGANALIAGNGSSPITAVGPTPSGVPYWNASGVLQTGALPAGMVSGLAPSATIDATNAGNISSGILALGRLPTIPTTQISGLG